VHQHAHGAAKGGVLAITMHSVVAGAAHGIRAVSVGPGRIITPATAPALDGLDGAGRQVLHGGIPAGRLGLPEDVARVSAFLASDVAAHLNGAEEVDRR
jgi:NAD(P)-dependent dehydrogenase (short-subunit alcohol dehydrogenase family)